MRVFLSWSGPLSHDLATVLHGWIPKVIQDARPFISNEDIEKGRRWSDVLGEQLSSSDYGIVCVTSDNVAAPWLHFEAGAISKAIDKSYVSPVLLKIEPSEIHGPLSQFQLTVCEKDDIFSLMRSINNRVPAENRLSEELLVSEFEEWWPKLEEELKTIKTKTSQIEDVTHTAYNWLYLTDDLTRANHKRKDVSIWWITPDPFTYLLKRPLVESIIDGISHNVAFTIMIPPTESNKEAIQRLNYIAPDKPEKFQIVEIPIDEFHRAAVTDYVVVDPNSLSPEVFLELPIAQRGYWIYLADGAAAGIVVRFRVLMETQGKVLERSATAEIAPPDAIAQATRT